MRRRVPIGGLLLFILGLSGFIEGLRLSITARQPGIYDVVGPDRYLLGVGIALMVTGSIYFFSQRKPLSSIKESTEKGSEGRPALVLVGATMSVLVLYGISIPLIGYAPASILFFFMIFKVLGLRSWLTSAVLSLVLTLIFQVLFGHFLGIALPKGLLNLNLGMS